MRADELESLLGSWLIDLASENRSPQTRKISRDGVRAFLSWCAAEGLEPALDRPTVSKFTADLLARSAPATARARQLAVRRFSHWLAAEEIIPRGELLGPTPPSLGQPGVPELAEDELAPLIPARPGQTGMDRPAAAI